MGATKKQPQASAGFDTSIERADRRRAKLKQLIDELGGFADAARLFGMSRGTLSRLANSGQKFSRPLTDDEVRNFERKAGKPAGWMDSTSIYDPQQTIDASNDRINLTIEEDIPPRSQGLRMKDYGEKLFLEAWSHRLRINAIRHRGLDSVVNISVWRSGWLSVIAKGRLTIAEAQSVVDDLRAMKEAIHSFSSKNKTSDIVIFPSDTVTIGEGKPQDTTYLIDPKPAPPTSIHTWLNQRQLSKAQRFGDLVAVFQVSIWGDATLRGAFSGFPWRQDAVDVQGKLDQLCKLIAMNTEVHKVRQAN